MNLRRYFRRNKRDAELRREFDHYLAQEIEDNLARGYDHERAYREAHRKFGNQTAYREVAYEMNTVQLADNCWRHLVYGARQLRRSRGFAVTAILSLGLGIGANTAVFQLLDAVRLRSLPVHNPQELMAVKIDGGNRRFGVAIGPYEATNPLWEQIQDHQEIFSGIFAWGIAPFDLGSGDQQRPIRGMYASGGIFSTLGIQPYRGRLFSEADDRRGCAAGPAVISYAMWQRDFGGAASAVGERVVVNGKTMEIVGVTPPEFFGLEVGKGFDLAVPNCARRAWGNMLDQRHIWNLNVLGRLKPGITAERAAQYLKVASAAWFHEVPPTGYDSKALTVWNGFRLTAEPGGNGVSQLRSQYERSLWLLLGITGLVLLIACANLANLLLARAASREREMAVRLAIGASRGQLTAQLLTESLLLAGAGVVCAAVIASMLSRSMVRFLSTAGNVFQLDFSMDWRVAAFLSGAGIFTCLLFGLIPALKSSRADAFSAMKSGGRSSTADRHSFSLQRLFIVSQVAVSVMLVMGAFLFVRSFQNILAVDPGFRQDGMAFNFIDFRPLQPAQAAVRPLQREMLLKVRSIPGIEAAATSTHVPLSGSSWSMALRVPGADANAKLSSQVTWVSPEYFKTMQIPFRAGRDFTEQDTTESRKVAIVNQAFVAKIFNGADPLGQVIHTLAEPAYPEAAYEIVGVVGDTRYSDLRDSAPAIAYAPESQNPQFGPRIAIVFRSAIPTAQALASVRGTITASYPGARLEQLPLRAMVNDRLVRERLLAWLSGFFGLLAAGLAMIGLYGVISHMAARRQTEIGIRLALGAGRGHVAGLFLRQMAVLFAIGLTAGVLGSLAAARGASALLFGIAPSDPLTLAFSAGALALVGTVATLIPSWRASRLDPIDSLRAD